MARSMVVPVSKSAKQASSTASSRKFGEVLSIAQKQGLLSGARTLTVRGRMPSLLVEQAKKKTGIQSDSELIETALANIVAADDYGEWLLAQRGTVSKDLKLEF
jgi:hypothetical protein